MALDRDRCYRAVEARDARFDGVFVTAVTSTGIYCRPSCPATTPKPANVVFYAEPAAAVDHGFRACRRCRPDAAPGSPQWNVRADTVARAMRLIHDGRVDRDGVAAVAARLGYSPRHLTRQMSAELGAGPLAIARRQRAATARFLLETTDLPVADIAFAAGFGSIRAANENIRQMYGATPSQLRRRSHGGGPARPGGVSVLPVRLATREPFQGGRLLAFLGARAVPGVEAFDGRTYRRSARLPGGPAVLDVTAQPAGVGVQLTLTDLRDLQPAVARLRRALDLDADPVGVTQILGADPLLGPVVRRLPGLRSPAGVDPAEMAVRAVVGQQISVAGAATVLGRITARFGEPLPDSLLDAPTAAADGPPTATPTHMFPTAASLAAADPADLPMPRSRAATLVHLCSMIDAGDLPLDPGADRAATIAALGTIKGIGPWTAHYIAMRALGDPDAWIPSDLGVRRGAERLGGAAGPARIAAAAEHWRPWRSYATHYLWAALGPGTNTAEEEDAG